MNTQMNSELLAALQAGPVYPNAEYEIRKSGLTLSCIARKMHTTIKTLKRKLAGQREFYADEAVALLDILGVNSFEYLMYSPSLHAPTLGETEVARTVFSMIQSGVICDEDCNFSVVLRHLSRLDQQRGQILLHTLLNLADMNALPGQKEAANA